MILDLKQKPILAQKLIMTPQLQLAVKLLQLSRQELVERIRQELEENPALEEIGEISPSEESPDADEKNPTEINPADGPDLEERLVDALSRDQLNDSYDFRRTTPYELEARELLNFENFTSNRETLTDHLLWQLVMTSPTPEEEKIGSVIAGSLDRNGYLTVAVAEIAAMCETRPQIVEGILFLMQTFEPPGVCARDLRECLQIQIRQQGIGNALVSQIVSDHLHDLERGDYRPIRRATRAEKEDVEAAVKIIRSLEPRPARPFGDRPPGYIVPDIFVYKTGRNYTIALNNDSLPHLRVSSYCKEALQRADGITADVRSYLKERIRSAVWIINSIRQRQSTLCRVMESILKFQLDFFEYGVSHLKPLILRDVAEDIEMSEATISRTTTNKYVQTPRGIYSLKFFFSNPIRHMSGEPLSAVSVQEKIRGIIVSEDCRKPHTDDKIARLLQAENIDIARRTVAKYREKLGILPSSRRRRLN